MEELITAINGLTDSLQNSIPKWASVVGIIAPIVLTVVSIILSVRMDKGNKKLQKIIAERDQINQTRQYVLDIYNAFFSGGYLLSQANENIAYIFVSDQSYFNWSLEVENASRNIVKAYNSAKLIVKDDKFIKQLESAFNAFSEVELLVKKYIATGKPLNVVEEAWNDISEQCDILKGDYEQLYRNSELSEKFIALCDTSQTSEIQQKVSEYLKLTKKEEFDEMFKKYIQVKHLDI